MGDRAYCYLYLAAPPSDELRDLLNETLGAPAQESDTCLDYDEVNWAQLPPDVERYLNDNNLEWAWLNEAGGSYMPAARSRDFEYVINGGQILISVHDDIEKARKAQDYINKLLEIDR